MSIWTTHRGKPWCKPHGYQMPMIRKTRDGETFMLVECVRCGHEETWTRIRSKADAS